MAENGTSTICLRRQRPQARIGRASSERAMGAGTGDICLDISMVVNNSRHHKAPCAAARRPSMSTCRTYSRHCGPGFLPSK
jgi:hypothetical protein